MKYKLFKCDNELHLILATGEIKIISHEEVGAYILNFDSFESSGTSTPFAVQMFEQYHGEPILALDDNSHLIVYNANFLREIFFDEKAYLKIQAYADKIGKSRIRILQLCKEGRIPGAIQRGTKWYIPKDAPYPDDARAGRDMSKRYVNTKENN